MTTDDQKRMMENAQATGTLGRQHPVERTADRMTPHVHPDTVVNLEGRIGAIERRLDHGQPVTYGSGPFAHPEPGAASDTVYAHVERTVHALLTRIERGADRLRDQEFEGSREYDSLVVKTLAEAVQALSSWPQFNPMNAHADYQKLAEYQVQKAIKAYQDSPKFPACDCGMGVQAPAGFHLKSCKGFAYALALASAEVQR